MKKKIILAVLAGILAGIFVSAMPYADKMPVTVGAAEKNNSSLWENFSEKDPNRREKEKFVKDHVENLTDEELEAMLGNYFGNQEEKNEYPLSLYSYSFRKEINEVTYNFVQYTAVIDQDSLTDGVRMILPQNTKFVTGYGELTGGYRAYKNTKEAVREGEDISDDISPRFPNQNVICWDVRGDGTYSCTVELIGDETEDAIWIVDGCGYTGSEDISGKVTIPEKDLDSDMLVGDILYEDGNHGTLDGKLYFMLKK